MSKKMSRAEAGAKGGGTTKKRYGAEHYRAIGKKGGTAVSRDREHMSRIGRIGGGTKRRHQ